MKNTDEIEWILNRHLDDVRKKILKDLTPKNNQPKKLKGNCFFPIEYSEFDFKEKGTDGFSGPTVKSPFFLNTYVYDAYSMSDPDYYIQVDLRQAVKSMIEGHEMGGRGGAIEQKYHSMFKFTAAALRHLSDKLDDATKRK